MSFAGVRLNYLYLLHKAGFIDPDPEFMRCNNVPMTYEQARTVQCIRYWGCKITTLDGYEEYFAYLIRALETGEMIDRRDKFDVQSFRHGHEHGWFCFLQEFGFQKELNEMGSKLGPTHRFRYLYHTTAKTTTPEIITIRREVLRAAKESLSKRDYYKLRKEWNIALHDELLAYFDWHFGEDNYVAKNLRETTEGMEILLGLERDPANEFHIDWDMLGGIRAINYDYVAANLRKFPWNFDQLSRHAPPHIVEIFLRENLISDYECLWGNTRLALPWLFKLLTGHPRSSELEWKRPPPHGVWQIALYQAPCGRFRRHAAAGVLQRYWRRHRERVRRKQHAEWLAQQTGTSHITSLPVDLQWLIYRYVRPHTALRGLPCKYW